MEIDLAVLADAATIDGNGKLNILGIFDRIGVSRFPAKHGRIALVLRFAAGVRDAGSHRVGIRLRSPDGSEMVNLDGNMQFGPGSMKTGGGVRIPHVLNLDGLVFEGGGHHTFDIQVDGVHHCSIPLVVDELGAGAGAQA